MPRYLHLLRIFYQNTLVNELEYRVNFLSNIFQSVFWLVWSALSVRVYFFHADSILGWTYYELLIVMGLFFVMNGFRLMLLTPNLSRLSHYVKMGTLDYILTKPVNSQFMVSLRYIGVFNWSDPLLGLGLVVYALAQLGRQPGPADIALFALLLLAGMILLYSFNLMLQTLTIWLVSVERVDTLVQGTLETGRFPVSFYRGWVGTVFTFIIPVAFMTTFPAQALLGRLDNLTVLGALLLAALLFTAASLFWRFALRSYTGASS